MAGILWTGRTTLSQSGFGFSSSLCSRIISDLVSREIVAEKVKVGETVEFICDSQNLERLFG